MADPATGREPARRRLLVFRLCNGFARVLLWLVRVRVEVEGAEHVPDIPAVILASNHLSIMDPVLLTLAVQDITRRRVRYMAKSEALEWPFFGPLLRAYGGFTVRRGRPDREAYRVAQGVLQNGEWLGLAPEGHRSRTGSLTEPKPGVARLAMRSGAPVLPAGIWGSERFWPIGARLPRPGTIVKIRFGELYRPAAAARAGEARRESIDASTEDLMRRIAALLPHQYRGRFG